MDWLLSRPRRAFYLIIISAGFIVLFLNQLAKDFLKTEIYWFLNLVFGGLPVSAGTALMMDMLQRRGVLEPPERQSARLKQFMMMEEAGFEYYAPDFNTFEREIILALETSTIRELTYIVLSGFSFHRRNINLFKKLVQRKGLNINILLPNTKSEIGNILARNRDMTAEELEKRIERGIENLIADHKPNEHANLHIFRYSEIPSYTVYNLRVTSSFVILTHRFVLTPV